MILDFSFKVRAFIPQQLFYTIFQKYYFVVVLFLTNYKDQQYDNMKLILT